MTTAKSKVTGIPDQGTATKKERPAKGTSRAEGRPKRNAKSIAEFRDILGVQNKEPGWRYRWVQSTKEFDKRIYDARRAGWDFVDADKEESLIRGEYAVARTETDGSLYRIPAGRSTPGEYLYLMRMPEDYAAEVDSWKNKQVDDMEADLFRKRQAADDPEQGLNSYENHTITHEDRYRLQDD